MSDSKNTTFQSIVARERARLVASLLGYVVLFVVVMSAMLFSGLFMAWWTRTASSSHGKWWLLFTVINVALSALFLTAITIRRKLKVVCRADDRTLLVRGLERRIHAVYRTVFDTGGKMQTRLFRALLRLSVESSLHQRSYETFENFRLRIASAWRDARHVMEASSSNRRRSSSWLVVRLVPSASVDERAIPRLRRRVYRREDGSGTQYAVDEMLAGLEGILQEAESFIRTVEGQDEAGRYPLHRGNVIQVDFKPGSRR